MILPPAQLERILAQADTLAPPDALRLLSALGQEVIALCAQDGKFFLRFVQTRDEADPLNPVKSFPRHEEYTQLLWDDLCGPEPVVMAKSRQMLASWELATFCTWMARFKPNLAIYWQTKAWEDAVAMVCMPEGGFEGRCQFIENHLPMWMQVAYKPAEGRIQYPNGSIIQALSGGAGKIRSKTASVIVEDEFAHQEEQDGVYTAVAPLIQKGAKVIFVSSPNGANNQFATLYHGRPVGTESTLV